MADFRKKDARSVAFPHFAENELATVSTIEKTLGTLVFSKVRIVFETIKVVRYEVHEKDLEMYTGLTLYQYIFRKSLILTNNFELLCFICILQNLF